MTSLKNLFISTKEDLLKDNKIFDKIKDWGVVPSPEDSRDFVSTISTIESEDLPKEYLSNKTEVLNQGLVCSCVAHSCATAIAQCEEAKLKTHNEYSRGYIYGNRRITDRQSEGMIIRQALKQLNHCGTVLYAEFPFNKPYEEVKKLIEENKEELADKASEHKIYSYYRCYSKDQIKVAVMKQGSVIICAPVYSNFSRDLHTPEKSDKKDLRGYHAMAIVGWTADNKWIVQNSWGTNWGYDGKLLMDEDYPITEYWAINIIQNSNTSEHWYDKIINLIKKFFSLFS